MEKPKVLWLDDNKRTTSIFIEVLEAEGYDVDWVRKVSEAVSLLGSSQHYDLVILDVMIPTWTAEEEKLFPPRDTNRGLKTGLYFYRYMRDMPQRRDVPVFVFTMRLEQEILEAFVEAGLPKENYDTMYALRDPDEFIEKIDDILGRGE